MFKWFLLISSYGSRGGEHQVAFSPLSCRHRLVESHILPRWCLHGFWARHRRMLPLDPASQLHMASQHLRPTAKHSRQSGPPRASPSRPPHWSDTPSGLVLKNAVAFIMKRQLLVWKILWARISCSWGLCWTAPCLLALKATSYMTGPSWWCQQLDCLAWPFWRFFTLKIQKFYGDIKIEFVLDCSVPNFLGIPL